MQPPTGLRRYILLLNFILAIATAGAQSQRLPPHSFVVRPVGSVQELAKQIRTEPVVGARYAMHFGVNAFVLADYIKKNLRKTLLPKDAVYAVYFVRSNSNIYVKKLRLKKGTAVFVSKDGTPVLKANCGNPMVRSLAVPIGQPSISPFQVAMAPTLAAQVDLSPTLELIEVPTLVGEVVVGEVVAGEVAEAPALTEVVTAPVPEVGFEAALPPRLMPAQLSPPPVAVAAAAAPWGPLPLMPLLPRGRAQPIPEPSTITTLTFMLGFFYSTARWVPRRFKKSNALSSPSRKNCK